MRLGIYGGTFDPVHYGHLLLAEQCREACALDEVWFVPAAIPPHKRQTAISSGTHRMAMLELAVAGMPQFKASPIELDRDGPSYTVETLREVQRLRPDDRLFLLIGNDSVQDFPTRREPGAIAELATIVAVNRAREIPDVSEVRRLLGDHVADRIEHVSMPGIDISASDLRRRGAAGRSIRFQTPRAVEQYVQEHQLYARAAD